MPDPINRKLSLPIFLEVTLQISLHSRIQQEAVEYWAKGLEGKKKGKLRLRRKVDQISREAVNHLR